MMITSDLIDVPGVGFAQRATLERSSVTFVLPDGDDRDHDSQTSIQLKKQDGTAFSGEDNVAPGQHMKDPGTYGPYNLPVQTEVDQMVYKSGFCEVTHRPNGNDDWIVNIVIRSRFTDGTIVVSQSGVVRLSRDNGVMRFGL